MWRKIYEMRPRFTANALGTVYERKIFEYWILFIWVSELLEVVCLLWGGQEEISQETKDFILSWWKKKGASRKFLPKKPRMWGEKKLALLLLYSIIISICLTFKRTWFFHYWGISVSHLTAALPASFQNPFFFPVRVGAAEQKNIHLHSFSRELFRKSHAGPLRDPLKNKANDATEALFCNTAMLF